MSPSVTYHWIVEAFDLETGRTLSQSIAGELETLADAGHDVRALAENERLVAVRRSGSRLDRAIARDGMAPRYFMDPEGTRAVEVPYHMRRAYRRVMGF